MKKIVTVLLVLFLSSPLLGQNGYSFGSGSMVIGGNAGISALGFGFGGSFEFGFSKTWGIQANYNINSYDVAGGKWSIAPLDLWATYHNEKPFGGFGDASYYMGGVSIASLSFEPANGKESKGTGTLFGFGYGTIFNMSSNLNAYVELRYRLGSLEDDANNKLIISWYSAYAGVTFSL